MAVTAAGVGLAVSLGSSLVSGFTSLGGAGAEKAAAKRAAQYNVAVAQMNRLRAEDKATDARKRGDITSVLKAQETSQLVGLQRAMLAAKGLDPNQGSAAQLQVDAVGTGKLEQLTIEANSIREALGFEHQAELFGIDERFAQTAASKSGGGADVFDAFGTLATTGADVFKKIQKFTPKKKK